MTTGPWWVRYPQVLQEEEAGLERLAGCPVEPEPGLLEHGVRHYIFDYKTDFGILALTVTYADLHPFFKVRVAYGGRLSIHHHPFGGELCLLAGQTWNWDVSQTAAELIEEQLPKLLEDHAAKDAGREAPSIAAGVPHVEPFAGYFSAAPETVIRIDGSWDGLANTTSGNLLLGLELPVNPNALRATVLEIRDASGAVLCAAEPAIVRTCTGPIVEGRWCRLEGPPAVDGGEGVLQAALAVKPEFSKIIGGPVDGVDIDVVGVVFEDELTPGRTGDAWLFVVRALGPRPRQGAGGGRVAPARPQVGPYLASAMRSGRSDIAARIPTLRPLANKKVIVFGAGGLGAPSAIEFAKAQIGQLTIVEFDQVEAGTSVRWPLGFHVAGRHKLAALQSLIASNWPLTALELEGLRLGEVRFSAHGDPQPETLDRLLEGADLIYDATAEIGVNYFLSELAKERALPYILVSATEGGWGGRVARFLPGADAACWTCLMHHEQDKTIPVPPADPDAATGTMWPAGCADATFTGTGFDIASVALAGVRLSAATLCDGVAGSYPPASWDLAIYAFRDGTETLPGTAKTYSIDQHPDCEPCRRRRSG